MIGVEVEQDRVLLVLGGRRSDVLLSCAAALTLAAGLEQAATLAEAEAPALALGEVWDVKVESFDGMVAVRARRVNPPLFGFPERVPMSAAAARRVAEMVRMKASQAEHKMRLVLSRG